MKTCTECGGRLSVYNPGPTCWACQPKVRLTKAHLGGCALHGKADWNDYKRRCRICANEQKRRRRKGS